MKKISIYLSVVLILFIQNALAAESWSEDYCTTYDTLRTWYKIANTAHNNGDSVTALEFYYALRLIGFGKGSTDKPWPGIRQTIDDRIEYHQNRLKEMQVGVTRTRHKIMMKGRSPDE